MHGREMTGWISSRPPNTLYKFKSYTTLADRMRVRWMLTRGEVYFARASEFNDPFELKPRWIPRWKSDTERRRFIRDEVAKDVINRGIPHLRRALFAQALRNSLPDKMRENQRGYHQVLDTQVNIFCMAGNRDDLLMWSHYGQSHTGLCIHIDGTAKPFIAALPVHYSTDYPSLVMPAEDPDEAFRVGLLTKAMNWKSENEYRLLRLLIPGVPSLDIKWNKQVGLVPPNVFTGVTLGARMPSKYRRTFEKMARHAPHPFEVWTAKVSDAEFKLDFERLV